jgi:hypothetical protein
VTALWSSLNSLSTGFLIGEVIEPGYEFDPATLDDFNHVLHVRPLISNAVSIDMSGVSAALKHDLSKRGQYYQIYPERSLQELDDLVTSSAAGTLDPTAVRGEEDTHDRTLKRVKDAIIRELSQNWRSKDFEKLCRDLCDSLNYIR